MGNRPYQEPFTPDSSGSLPVSQVWHDFRRHERALARMGFYLEDLAALGNGERLNQLKSNVLKRWREYDGGDFDTSAVSSSREELKAAATWFATLTWGDVEELSVGQDSPYEPQPSQPYVMYAVMAVLGGAIEYLITHWLHR